MGCRSGWASPGYRSGRAIPSGRQGSSGVQKNFPARLTEIARTAGPDKTLELWFADESWVGQKRRLTDPARLTQLWHAKGHRRRGLRDHRFRSAWIFGAGCPDLDVVIGAC